MKYEVETKFVFSGKFTVEAKSAEEANRLVGEYCGMTMSGGIESALSPDDCDWEFDVHAETIAGKARKIT
ncbi:MAG: hypothetical protein LBC76_08235 [Treponema sp.]|jgi:hypothetical protein|nr:hypothetical protein [Treponema sp.]